MTLIFNFNLLPSPPIGGPLLDWEHARARAWFPQRGIMIVCHCKGISDRALRRAIRQGADSIEEVASACRAGEECGGCRPAIERLLETHRRQPRRAASAALGELAPSR
jgi:bacterioferritin-associated ferredoxin